MCREKHYFNSKTIATSSSHNMFTVKTNLLNIFLEVLTNLPFPKEYTRPSFDSIME